MIFSVLSSLVIIEPLIIFRKFFTGFFFAEQTVIQNAHLRIMCILFFEPLCSFYEIPAGVLRGTGHSLSPAIAAIIGTCCFRIIWIYTIFHNDDHTFSDCWTDFSEDFNIFYQDILKDMATAATKKGIKAKEGQPANFYCISCTPWTTFTGYSSRVSNGEPSFFPIVLMGKYKQHGKKILMPVNITIAHAVADGYHVGLFFQYLQEEINNY